MHPFNHRLKYGFLYQTSEWWMMKDHRKTRDLPLMNRPGKSRKIQFATTEHRIFSDIKMKSQLLPFGYSSADFKLNVQSKFKVHKRPSKLNRFSSITNFIRCQLADRRQWNFECSQWHPYHLLNLIDSYCICISRRVFWPAQEFFHVCLGGYRKGINCF